MENSNFIVMKKTDRRIRRTKRSITTAFLQLMKEKDISKITVKELCDLADINRKTFYTYYSNVNDVLSEIENNVIAKLENRISELKKSKQQITVSDVFVCTKELLELNSEFIRHLAEIDALQGIEHKVRTSIKKVVLDVLSNEYPTQTAALAVALEYIVSGVVSMHIEWFYAEDKILFETLSEMTMDFINANIKTALRYSEK